MEDVQDPVLFLLNPSRWPHGNYCPMYREGNHYNRGLVFSHETTTVVVLSHQNHFTVREWHAAHRIKYPSVTALVADGWRID